MEGDWRKTRQWSHGLCGCFDNMSICCLALWVPCVLFGQTSEGLGKSCCSYCCIYMCWPVNWCMQAHNRSIIREIRGIPGSCVTDCCLVSWCTLCTLAQEAQEVELLNSQQRAREAAAPLGGTSVIVSTNSSSTVMAPPSTQPYPHQVYSHTGGAEHHIHDGELQPQHPAGVQDFGPPAYSADDVKMNRY